MAMRRSRMTRKFVIPTERQEQRALVKWLSLHPQLKDYFCKNNNEGQRTPAQTHNLKLEGLRPGVSDLFIYYPVGSFCGLWLEIKRSKAYTKSEISTPTWMGQIKFQEDVKRIGYAAFFAFGWLDAKNIIERYLDVKSDIHNPRQIF